MTTVRRVCLVSGGTGGHLMPALVLARAMRGRGHLPLLVTEGREVEREILRRELPDVREVRLPPAARVRLALPIWLVRATFAARRLLREHGIDDVVITGGRPSVPVGLAARSLGLPLYLLEQNAVMGRANRWLQRFARRVYQGLPFAHQGLPFAAVPSAGGAGERRRFVLTGTPLRSGIGSISRAEARAMLGLDDEAPVVLVTGGSQGAQSLNQIVPRALLALDRPLQVLHLAGMGRDEAVRVLYAGGRLVAHVRPVALDMDRMLAAADLVICRGGGTTVAELAAVGRPAVIVPYPHHKDRQQLHNARVLADRGAAIVIEEPQLSPETLRQFLAALFDDPARLLAMASAAKQLHTVDAVDRILGDMGLLSEGGGLLTEGGL
ncbi:MAG: UDP-N-acetylglucosamine--N-acetylmuramyl-(pentapeptide) pyrophosphoryl-undecaprenol N-acetylglucosamine transferase, partial [Planctomycetes bacterium]|nr:UDP-N-acetylglucosamine--N-acetylmuramyl-(pentapeptide) pyrophosphoryl-undecaprenol N-acetylglucosamine transferase [Planctomycetota bacterium]